MFAEQIRHTMEVYVDGMLVKSDKMEDHVYYLNESFAIMKA